MKDNSFIRTATFFNPESKKATYLNPELTDLASPQPKHSSQTKKMI